MVDIIDVNKRARIEYKMRTRVINSVS